jgi:P27 family predicted phage terminase small subunit
MGRRGPAKKPTAQRKLGGNASKRPLNEEEWRPPAASGLMPPSWVRGKGRRAWKEIAPLLEADKVVSEADRHALALLCDAYGEYIEAREHIRRHGRTYTSRRLQKDESVLDENGEPVLEYVVMVRTRPEVGIAQDAWKRVRAMMQDFGLTPRTRSGVKSGEGGEDNLSDFAKWAARGKQTA